MHCRLLGTRLWHASLTLHCVPQAGEARPAAATPDNAPEQQGKPAKKVPKAIKKQALLPDAEALGGLVTALVAAGKLQQALRFYEQVGWTFCEIGMRTS